MPALSLPDYIELVSSISKSIRTNVSEPEDYAPGFYTSAALRAPLEDLIREADPSEVGLFTLVPPPSYGAGAEEEGPGSATQVTRADLPSATPLRPRTGREIKTQEHEPEVYANAALRFLDRYQSIQPMPRARVRVESILEQLAALRVNIENLVEQVKQNEPSGSSPLVKQPQQLIQEEVGKIEDLQARIVELRERKAALAAKKAAFLNSSRFQSLEPASPPPPPSEDQREHSFWNTPGPTERTMNFEGGLLLDESVNLGDISISSFGTPLPAKGPLDFDYSLAAQPRFTAEDDESEDGQETAPPLPLDKVPAEPTGTVQRVAPPGPPEGDRTPSPKVDPEPQTPSRRPKIQITMEMEGIVAKIWTTVGDLIQPGYQHPVEGKALCAKETLSVLRTLASKTPVPSSPTDGSLSSFSTVPTLRDEPTVQQIQTAQLLLALLGAQPSYTLPMNRLKKIMNGNAGATGAPHTRALYACVAKRLVKIERGKGEQTDRPVLSLDVIMGKLNIAHHKSYHPYRRDNIERVRRDEEEARLKETAAEGRILLADSEARVDLLRSRAGVSSKPSKRQQEREEEKLLSQRTSDVIESSQGHVNLFEDLEKQEMIISTKVKKPDTETDKGVPLAPSEKDLKPWYSEKGKGRTLDEMDNDMRIRDTNRKSRADPLTSINSQLANSSAQTPSSSSRRDWRRPSSGSRMSDPDRPPSQLDARLSRESAERQRARELIERKKREMAGSATPSTVRSGYGDMYNRVEVEEARRSKGRGWDRRQ